MNNTGGTKRANTYAGENLPSAQSARTSKPTSEELLASLHAKIRHIDPFAVKGLLECIAEGNVSQECPPDDEISEFSAMLLSGDFELFVATYHLVHEQLSAAVKPGEAPHRRTLVLRLPSDWHPAPAALVDALRQVQVDRLHVLPGYQVGLGQSRTKTPVPAAVSLCVATLLNTGLADLTLGGMLVAPDAIAEAIPTSGLRSITFAREPGRCCLPDEVEGYRKIMAALATCPTLRHLAVEPPELLQLHSVVGRFQHSGGPRLASVAVGSTREWTAMLVDAVEHSANFLAFMNQVSRLPTVSVCRLEFMQVNDAESLDKHVFQPLSQSGSLTTLDMHVWLADDSLQAHLLTLPKLATFLTTRRSLVHFKWNVANINVDLDSRANGVAGTEIDAHLRNGGELDSPEAAKAWEAVIAQPDSKLESLSLIGMPLPPMTSRTLFDGIARNTRLRHLSLLACLIEARSAAHLTAALKSNHALESIWVPRCLHEYYLVMNGQRRPIALGLMKGKTVALHLPQDITPADTESARALLGEIRELMQALFRVSFSVPLANQRAALARVAHRELVPSTQAFLASAMRSAPTTRKTVDAEWFSLAAQRVLEHLDKADSLRTAVRLSEVDKRSDASHVRERRPGRPLRAEEQALRTLVTEHNNTRRARDRANEKFAGSTGKILTGEKRFGDDVPIEVQLPPGRPGPRHVLLRSQLSASQADLFMTAIANIAFGDDHSLWRTIQAGAPLNVVDGSARNELLMLAVATHRPDLVRMLVELGAKDFDGHAQRAASSSAMAHAFDPPSSGGAAL